jgi:hypothetical protein
MTGRSEASIGYACRLTCGLLLLAALTGVAHLEAADVEVEGLLTARGVYSESRRSWLQGGFGRFTIGGAEPGDGTGSFVGKAQLGLDVWLSDDLRLFAHGRARYDGEESPGSTVGLAEGYLEFQPSLSDTSWLRLRAGLLFPGISRENVGPLWSSPYTITLSALNTWTAEEMKVLGLETRLSVQTGTFSELQLAGTAFGFGDPSGSLVSWRGWSMSDRLTVAGEVLPLPPLRSLAPSGGFAPQRDDGTRPVDELDERVGWLGLARWSREETITVQGAYVDNRGDRELYRGQYSWRTRFGVVGGDLHLGPGVVLVGEFLWGDTGMGMSNGSFVQIDMRAAYALVSWATSRTRLTVRYDYFDATDRDGTEERNDDRGRAWTAAFFWNPVESLRIGIEYVDLDADPRAAAEDSGFDPDTDGRRVTLEARFSF